MADFINARTLLWVALFGIAIWSFFSKPSRSDTDALKLYADIQGIKILAIKKWRFRQMLDWRFYVPRVSAADYFIIFTQDPSGTYRRLKAKVEPISVIAAQTRPKAVVLESVVVQADVIPPTNTSPAAGSD